MKTLFWILLTALIIGSVAPAQAQQPGARPYRVEAGPFRIVVFSQPSRLSLGTIDYVITLAQPVTAQPVTDARVTIKAVSAEGGQKGIAIALNTPANPGTYTARVELDAPGVWRMSVDISNQQGHVEIEAPSQVVPIPRQSTAGGLVFFGAFVFIALGALYVTWAVRRAQKSRESSSAA